MINLFICGDIVNQLAKEQFIESNLSRKINESDYAICNLEGPILPVGAKLSSGIYQNNSTLNSLKEAGFNLLLLGNNHITDYGKEGLTTTINEAKKHSFDFIGAGFSIEDVYKAKILEINGLKFGLINIGEAQVGSW